MAKTRAELVLEFRKLRSEWRKARDDDLRRVCLESINTVLDARLESKGAHPAECGCWECAKHVADVMARRVNA